MSDGESIANRIQRDEEHPNDIGMILAVFGAVVLIGSVIAVLVWVMSLPPCGC